MSNENQIPNEDIIRMAEKEEPRFLNILLKDRDLLSDAVSFGIKPTEGSKPGHFIISKNNFLYTLIYKNFNKYGTLLTRSAMDSIVDMQDFGTEEDKAAIKGYWDKIWNRHDVSLEDYSLLRDHINDRYILWQFYEKWKTGDTIIKSTGGHADLVKKFTNNINSIENIDADPYSLTMGIDEGINEALKFIEDRREHPENNDNIFTGIKGIDDIYHGFPRGSYTVISGLINGGKTTLAMNIGFNMAKSGYNVAYVSLEKEAKLFFRRVLSLHALTDYNRIKEGGKDKFGLNDYWYGKLQEAARDLRENIKPHYDCLQFVQGTKLTKILSEIDKLRARKKLDVWIIDYLGVIGFESNHPTRPDLDLAEVHKRIMAYGKVNKLVTFDLLQLKMSSSKEIRKRADKVTSEADMSSVSVDTEDYAGSQMVIADADNAMGVVLNRDRPPTKMFISFSKARDDESRRVICLDFDGKVARVSDPQYGESQIKDIDKLIYDEKNTEVVLSSDESLFDSVKSEDKETTNIESSGKDVVKDILELEDENSDESDVDESTIDNNVIKDTENPSEENNIKGLESSEGVLPTDDLDPFMSISKK